MESNNVFFSENGLTSTSANHVANLAKEYVQNIEKDLSNTSFINTSVSIIDSNNDVTISIGKDATFLELIENKLNKISAAKSLIAWLREALKAKEKLQQELNQLSLYDWIKTEKNETVPVYPERDDYMTEDDYYASLNIKDRNRYYMLETQAAVYGKYIHPSGAFSKAREELSDKLNKPHEVKEDGRDTIIYNYNPSVEQSKVEDLFFKLQKDYRQVQAQLNGMKHECELALSENRISIDNAYKEELEKYNQTINKYNVEYNLWTKKKSQEYASLKIAIPDNLKSIYNEVNSL
jgi:hypothetical protein